jgi:hypothetical protein
MKMLVIVAASLFFLALPVHAQTHGGPAPQLAYAGGGSPGGFSLSSNSVLPSTTRTEHYALVYEQGSDSTFVPTQFVAYDAAVKLGQAALAYRPKSVVEAAAECRAAKKRAETPSVTSDSRHATDLRHT